MSKKILVTNDDGIDSKGIASLIEVAKTFGDVVVVAPDKPQSGQGHAITLVEPIRVEAYTHFNNVTAYKCSGTPVDCVKMAKSVLFKNEKIDLCVSGINHGSNASLNIIYSGTMSAAMEASLYKINSIGFSLLDYASDANFKASQHYAAILIKKMLAYEGNAGKLLNVNIPKLTTEEIKGIKMCKQGKGGWLEQFQKGEDPRGGAYYWMGGTFENHHSHPESDLWALEHSYVSVVPCQHDLTDYLTLKELNHFENI